MLPPWPRPMATGLVRCEFEYWRATKSAFDDWGQTQTFVAFRHARDYLRHELHLESVSDVESVGVGGHIDPSAHDVYEGGKRALALSSVPFDTEHRFVSCPMRERRLTVLHSSFSSIRPIKPSYKVTRFIELDCFCLKRINQCS